MNSTKISIIMPVFKVENYVGRAIESILNQTLCEWELLAVDDGSPDKSGKICDEYAKRDARIKVIHQENRGAPAARNRAIDLAVGKYLYFMDSDDWAERDMLLDMYNLAEANNSQLVIAGYYIDSYYDNEKKHTQSLSVPSRTFQNAKDFRMYAHKLFDKNLLYTPWNKLFLSEYIKQNKIYFPNTFWDDFPFVLSVISDIEHIAVTENKYYHFIRKRAESETARYRSNMYEKREEENEWMRSLYKKWQISSPETEEFLCRRYIERIIGCIENITNDNCNLEKKEKLDKIRDMICSVTAQDAVLKAKPNSLVMKILLIPIKQRKTSVMYLFGTVISQIKKKNVKLFIKLKANR